MRSRSRRRPRDPRLVLAPQDLSNKIRDLFNLIDADGNGTLNYMEIQVA